MWNTKSLICSHIWHCNFLKNIQLPIKSLKCLLFLSRRVSSVSFLPLANLNKVSFVMAYNISLSTYFYVNRENLLHHYAIFDCDHKNVSLFYITWIMVRRCVCDWIAGAYKEGFNPASQDCSRCFFLMPYAVTN